RKLGLDFQLHACGKECETFQQSLDVGVGDFDAIQAQTAGDLGKLARELCAHLAHMAEFLVIEFEQAGVHADLSARGSTSHAPQLSPLARLRERGGGEGARVFTRVISRTLAQLTARLASRTLTWPVSRSSSVRIITSSGTGCDHSRPVI